MLCFIYTNCVAWRKNLAIFKEYKRYYIEIDTNAVSLIRYLIYERKNWNFSCVNCNFDIRQNLSGLLYSYNEKLRGLARAEQTDGYLVTDNNATRGYRS